MSGETRILLGFALAPLGAVAMIWGPTVGFAPHNWRPDRLPRGLKPRLHIRGPSKYCDCCAQMCLRRIGERFDKRMIPQYLVDPRPLHSNPAPVNQPDFAQAGLVCRPDVFVHDRRNVARRERVQVDRLFDWNAVHFGDYFLRYCVLKKRRRGMLEEHAQPWLPGLPKVTLACRLLRVATRRSAPTRGHEKCGEARVPRRSARGSWVLELPRRRSSLA